MTSSSCKPDIQWNHRAKQQSSPLPQLAVSMGNSERLQLFGNESEADACLENARNCQAGMVLMISTHQQRFLLTLKPILLRHPDRTNLSRLAKPSLIPLLPWIPRSQSRAPPRSHPWKVWLMSATP